MFSVELLTGMGNLYMMANPPNMGALGVEISTTRLSWWIFGSFEQTILFLAGKCTSSEKWLHHQLLSPTLHQLIYPLNHAQLSVGQCPMFDVLGCSVQEGHVVRQFMFTHPAADISIKPLHKYQT